MSKGLEIRSNTEPIRLVGDDKVFAWDSEEPDESALVQPHNINNIILDPCTPEGTKRILQEDRRIAKHIPRVVDHPKGDTLKMQEVLNKWRTHLADGPYPELQGVCEYLSGKLGKGISIDFDSGGRMTIQTNLCANQLCLMSRSLRAAFPEGVDEAMGELILKNFKGVEPKAHTGSAWDHCPSASPGGSS